MRHPDGFAVEVEQRHAAFAQFTADLETGELRRDGVTVPIQRQPFEVLRTLLLARGRLVTRDALANVLWPGAVHVDFERGLTTAVRKVREALGDSGQSPRFIETLPGRGYRFICPVTIDGSADPAPRARPAIAAAALVVALIGACAVTTVADRVEPMASPRAVSQTPPTEPLPRPVSSIPAAASAWSAGAALLSSGREGDLREAVRWFDRAAALDPSLADAYAAGAEARMELVSRGFAPVAQVRAARLLARRAIELNPRSARARLVDATAGLLDGQVDRAAAIAESALADDPTFVRAYTTLACIRKRQGRLDEAAALAESALRLAPNDPVIVALAGFFAHSARRYSRERELLDRAAAMAPASVDVLWHVALGEARRRDYTDALATLDRALMLAPGSPRLLYWRGYVEAEAGRIAEARRTLGALRSVSRSGTTGPEAVASLQDIVEHRGR